MTSSSQTAARSKLVRKCEKLVVDICRARDVVCQRCGCATHWLGLEVAHIYRRGKSLRMKLATNNVLLLCGKCHEFMDSSDGWDWFASKWPDWAADLQEDYAACRNLGTVTLPELEDIHAGLKAEALAV